MSMAFVTNVIAPVDSRDYVLSGIYYSVLVRNTCQHSQQTRIDPMLVQCWPTACDDGPTSNQHWFSASCLLGCLQSSKHRIGHEALNKSWVNVGRPSVTLAHIQRDAKHDTFTQYWANVGSVSWTEGQHQPIIGSTSHA